MINILDPILAAGLDPACVKRLSYPMSHSARKLLNRHLLALTSKFAVKLHSTQAALVNKYSESFDPILYEDISQRFETDAYPGQRHSKWPTGPFLSKVGSVQEQYEYCARLGFFDSEEWLTTNSIKHRPHVGSITAEKSKLVYRWITTQFLLSDFSDNDLNKICEMGTPIFDLNTIKSYASQIGDPQKRSVPYLYAIARDASIKDAVSRTRRAEEEERQRQAFTKAIAYIATPKADFKVETEDIASIRRVSEYAKVFQDITNDKVR